MANVPITSLPEATTLSANDYLILQGENTQKIKWSALLDKIYPVGCIYQSASSTSPASFLGGTWEQIKDRFLLAAGDTYAAGSTGGEASHTLTVQEIPRDAQTFNVGLDKAGVDSNLRGVLLIQDNIVAWSIANENERFWASRGENAPHNNMPPYKAFYCWQRIE